MTIVNHVNHIEPGFSRGSQTSIQYKAYVTDDGEPHGSDGSGGNDGTRKGMRDE